MHDQKINIGVENPETKSSINRSTALQPASVDIEEESSSRWLALWEGLSHAGLAEITLRLGTHILMLALVLLVIWSVPRFFLNYSISPSNDEIYAATEPTPTPEFSAPTLPDYQKSGTSLASIDREVSLHTTIPNRPRFDVVKYTVKTGDTLFGIADKFGLKPETLLWGNQMVLGDNPHNLRPGQALNILPVNGTYYRWQAGDGLNGVADFFGVKPEDIVNWPGNHLDNVKIGDYAHPNIEPGIWLIVPGGKRAFVTWSAPDIPRDNPGVAKVLGPGACDSIPQGAIGSGMFIWPANHHFLSGFDYSPAANHPGIDIDGNTGDPVYAADSGVVVYAGWNNWGYGNVIVINHGNGWQTLYAHLNTLDVGCGQSMSQGNLIGAIGETGNASGSHLHFEMMYNGTKVNPWDYLPK